MCGHGIYLASDSTKSAQKEYTQGSNMLLVCKTLLGRCLTKNEPDNHLDRKKLRKQGFDSVFAPAGSAVRFDEYIVYDKRQTVVSFVVHFTQGSVKLPAAPISSSGNFLIHELRPQRGFDPEDVQQIHFRLCESHLLRQLQSNSHTQLMKVEYVVNPKLNGQFEEQRKAFQRHGISDEIILAFHGTRNRETVDSIVRGNFDTKFIGSQTDPGWWGRGFYFSEFPATSLGYGANMLLCRILPGRTYDVKERMDGQKLKDGYHSHRLQANKDGYGQELVIDNPKQILPCYILHVAERQ